MNRNLKKLAFLSDLVNSDYKNIMRKIKTCGFSLEQSSQLS